MKLPADLDLLCAKAVEIFGPECQEDIAFGEIGELITLLGRRRQCRDSPAQWQDEVADVIITQHQMAVIHGGLAVIEARIEEKVTKLRAKLAKHGYVAPLVIEVPADAAERLKVAEQLLQELLPLAQHANDCLHWSRTTRGAELTRLYAYLEDKKRRDSGG